MVSRACEAPKTNGENMNVFQSLAASLRNSGLSDYEAHEVQLVHRSAGGKLWHLNHSCGRLRRSTSVLTEKVDLASDAAWPVCSVCCPSVPERLKRLERIAYSFREQKQTFEEARQGALGWGTLGRCEAVIDQLAQMLSNPNASLWHSEMSALSAEVRVFLESVRSKAVVPSVVVRSCAVDFFNGSENAENPAFCTLGTSSSYSGSQRRVIEQHWRTWSSWIAGGGSYETAAAEAHKSTLNSLGQTPASFEQIPNSTRLNQADFPSLKAWIHAEWTRERDEVLTSLSQKWEEKSESIIASAASREDSIVLCPLDAPVGYRDDRLRLVLAPFAPKRLASASNMVVVRLPYLVAEWVDKNVRSNYRTRWFGRVAADESDSDVVLEVAAGLLDHSGGEMANLDVVVDVARATLG